MDLSKLVNVAKADLIAQGLIDIVNEEGGFHLTRKGRLLAIKYVSRLTPAERVIVLTFGYEFISLLVQASQKPELYNALMKDIQEAEDLLNDH